MLNRDLDFSRRSVLRAAGTVGGLSVVSGVASADETEEFNVGIPEGAAGAERAAKRAADSVRKTIDLGSYGRVVVGQFSSEARENLERNPNIDYVEPNYTAEKLGEKLPWGIDRVDADALHSEGTTGSGATLAILDTGVDDDHPDLADNVDPSLGAAFGSSCGSESGGCRFGREGYNGNDCNYEWSDDDDHGSHVAGTADAVRGNNEGVAGGVSTEATIMPVKVLDGCGSGSYADIADGVRYAADNGADVINMSLGGSSGDSTLKNACQYAYDNGVLLVAAAGNDGPCSDCVSYPAKYSTVMAVSATDKDDSLADYSSTGPEIELAAPGSDVLSTIPPESDDGSTYEDGYETFSGTSMATPHVAGTGGQVFANSSFTNEEIRQHLKDTAEDIGLASNEQGAGLVDAENAVDSLGSTDSAPSVSWVNPSDGETVSGTITVRIDASDSEDSDDSLEVTYNVDGGSSWSTSYNSTSGYYEDSLDTTQFSDGDHTFEANATDSAGNTSTSSITVTTDNTESAPTVDSLSVSEVETSDSDAEFDVDWSVSDGDGDLDSVDLSLTDDTDGESEDSASVSVSGDAASGTTRLVASGDDGSGNSYTVDATVTDSNGNTGSDSTTVSETEDTNSAPSASIDSLNNRSNPRWDRYEVDWSASDSDDNLDTVVVEMLDSSGNTLDSVTNDVSGSSASGVDEVRSKSNGTDIVVTATDTDGATGSDSRSI
jgi:subtilisin